MPAMNAAAASSGSDYKALVAVFLNGGNDSHSTIIPRNAGYAGYASGRGALSLAENTVLPLDGTTLAGLHPNLTGLQTLWNSGKLAAVTNVGPLSYPMTKAEYGSDYVPGSAIPRPLQLQSHSDQQLAWNSGLPDDKTPMTGWAGRMFDMVAPAFNPTEVVPGITTIAGRTRFQEGHNVSQYQMGPDGPDSFRPHFDWAANGEARSLAGIRAVWDATHGHPMEREVARICKRGDLMAGLVRSAATPITLATTFPNTFLGNQLRRVAIMIGARTALSHRRDIFFTQMGGFDTHSGDSLGTHAGLMTQVNDAILAFNTAMVELGVDNQVTLFTMSDFGRNLVPNGSGTDHGWGGHSFVVGGAVVGGRFYNKTEHNVAPTNSFPSYAVGGPHDGGFGRFIPTTSVDEYGATLCKWFGVPDALSNGVNPMNIIFPNLPRFSHRNLGFLP